MDAGTVLTGRFRLEEPLGRGAMGQVWRARDVKLNRDVAVKLLLAENADEVTFRRFLREAILPAGMQHPGIAVVHDADRDQGRPFIVTELLRGEDLGKLLKRHPKGLPVSQATDFAIQLADALAVAHEHGVVHRDLKPANLFVQSGDRLKICDFGMARDANATASLTVAGSVLGTPSYMSPEQWLGQDASPGMDIYAYGCILYEMLTGCVPFESGDAGNWVAALAVLQRKHLTDAPVPPRERNPDVPAALSDLALCLLAKEPASRPPNAASVSATLRRARDDRTQPIVITDAVPATPPTAPLACASVTSRHIEVMTVKGTGSYRFRNFWPESGWSPWTEDPGPGGALTAIAAAAQGDHAETILTVAGGLPYLRQWWRDEQGRWLTLATWADARDSRPFVPQGVVDIAMASPADGHVEVFALDAGRYVWHRCLRPRKGQQDAQWSLWEALPTPPGQVTAIAAMSQAENYQALAAVADGIVHLNYWDHKTGWGGWGPLGGACAAVDVACASPAPRAFEIMALDGDGLIHQRGYDGARWTDWERLPGPAGQVAAIAATSYGERHQVIAALTADGDVWCSDTSLWGTPQSHRSPWYSLDS
jgi:hypothetical protein